MTSLSIANRRRQRLPILIFAIVTLLLVLAFVGLRHAAADTGTGSVNITTTGVAFTENFDTLATAGPTNTTLPTGWYLTEQGGGARDNEQYAADNGGSNTGDIYSYGSVG